MGVKKKQHSAEFKARVAMASLSGEKTLTPAGMTLLGRQDPVVTALGRAVLPGMAASNDAPFAEGPMVRRLTAGGRWIRTSSTRAPCDGT